MPATPNCNICYMLLTMCLCVQSSWYEYTWFEIINPGNARICLGLHVHVGTYGGCVVHVVVGGERIVLWVAATLYMHRHTYSVQCSDKICFPQLRIKCGVAKSCPGTHTALHALAHPTALHPQDNPSVPTSNQHKA